MISWKVGPSGTIYTTRRTLLVYDVVYVSNASLIVIRYFTEHCAYLVIDVLLWVLVLLNARFRESEIYHVF
jgi:hypothetical protein